MIYNRLLETIILPLGDILTSSTVMRQLKQWRQIGYLSEDEIAQISMTNLNNILTETVQKVPYYKDFKKEKEMSTVEWLKTFPVMTKQEINAHINELTSKPLNQLMKKESSGSSGIHATTYMDKASLDTTRAIQMLWWEWAGWKIGQRILQTGITSKRNSLKAIKDVLLRTSYEPAFRLSPNEVQDILKKQIGRKNVFLAGYASSLFVLAKTASDLGISSKLDFSSSTSWGDKLFPHYKEEIESAFNCTVFDSYGASEGLLIAAQKDLEFYYIMSPHVFLEILDEDGNDVSDGEMGRVVVTRLDTVGMPFIRYCLGDLAIKLPRNEYPQNRELNFPLLKRVIGRDTDIVQTPNGGKMIVHFFTAIFQVEPSIEMFKIVQRKLEGIEIEYIKGAVFDDAVFTRVEDRIFKELNEKIEIIWREVNEISPTKSGKPQMIQSFLNKKE